MLHLRSAALSSLCPPSYLLKPSFVVALLHLNVSHSAFLLLYFPFFLVMEPQYTLSFRIAILCPCSLLKFHLMSFESISQFAVPPCVDTSLPRLKISLVRHAPCQISQLPMPLVQSGVSEAHIICMRRDSRQCMFGSSKPVYNQ
eukprot:Blabericola_migrator_1__5813@NODE_2944_length_2185_cov_119_591124_g848_i3_p3_GENE_NODE_2944_length_2185_cov_119_591124_g848_i3NODE_2944_length_2185_cov_119_591124_g848_i3_p3_ORF_typecomplete_len144_score2_24_NODE_2944_length_2185_cov_119_591124_g848_i316132044